MKLNSIGASSSRSLNTEDLHTRNDLMEFRYARDQLFFTSELTQEEIQKLLNLPSNSNLIKIYSNLKSNLKNMSDFIFNKQMEHEMGIEEGDFTTKQITKQMYELTSNWRNFHYQLGLQHGP